jgi:hypothetical protein
MTNQIITPDQWSALDDQQKLEACVRAQLDAANAAHLLIEAMGAKRELLEALQGLLRADERPPGTAQSEAAIAAMGQARAILAKATGGQP